MTLTIEINGQIYNAAAPMKIRAGEGQGILHWLPPESGCDAVVEECDRQLSQQEQKRIFICRWPTISLRPLVRYAAGFVFGEGTTLCHFARTLRANGVPSCIDQSLWQQASDAIRQSDGPLTGRLDCGHLAPMTDDLQHKCMSDLNRYHERLRGHRCSMPVYDAFSGHALPLGGPVDVKWGEKAMAVNALLAEKIPTAGALLLINPAARAGFHEDPCFISLLEKVFPDFGTSTDRKLIIRASLHSNGPSPQTLSGLLKSPAVTSRSQLASAIEDQVAGWKRIRDGGSALELTVVVQQRIMAKATGLISTGRPWDYRADGMVAALTLMEAEHRAAAWHHLVLDESEKPDHGQLPVDVAHRLCDRFVPPVPSVLVGSSFTAQFTQFIADALALSNRYTISLEIEFVMTDELAFKIVQFRPLGHVETASGDAALKWREYAGAVSTA